MEMTRQMKWIAMVVAAVFAALVFVGCGDDGVSATAPSIVSGDAAGVALASSRAHSDGDDASGDSPDDDGDDDDSDDDDSDDDDSNDDDSDDDDSNDDDSNRGSSGSDGDDARVRGLFFGIESCPPELDCVVAVRVKDTLVIVTNETRVDNEPALVERLPPSELSSLLGDHLGLPLRARGVDGGGGLVASELRIDDEIHATGMVVTPATGCEMSLLVRGSVPLCFALSPGLSAPAVGAEARIEGVVVDLVSPYRAVHIQHANN